MANFLAYATDPVMPPLLWWATFLPHAIPSAFERRFRARHNSLEVPIHILGGTSDIVVNNA